MRSLPLPAAFLFLSAPLLASDEVPFEPAGETYADAAACKAHLADVVARARSERAEAAEGPYEIAAGDLRAHVVLVAGSGHRITEHRCLAEKASSRTWRHSMEDAESEESETIASMAAKAEWLKKGD